MINTIISFHPALYVKFDFIFNLLLNKSLTNFVKIIEKNFKRKISNLVGGGAAGGTAAGLNGFFGATLDSGFFILSDLIGLEKEIKDFDLIFTAVGKIDHQSIEGKLTGNIAKMGKKYSIPVIGLTGRLVGDCDELYKSGFSGVFQYKTVQWIFLNLYHTVLNF